MSTVVNLGHTLGLTVTAEGIETDALEVRVEISARFNHWQLDLTLAAPLLQPRQHPPRDNCTHQLPAPMRQMVCTAHPGRWDHLDTK